MFLIRLLALIYLNVASTLAAAANATPSPDHLLSTALADIQANHPDEALANVDRAIAIRPDFKLAYLIKGDLLMAKSGSFTGFGAATSTSGRALDDLKDEARVRLLSQLDHPAPDTLPAQVLQLAPDQKYALLADASKARVYVLENQNGEPHLVRDFYLSLGKNGVGKTEEGDKKSPLGVYTLNRALAKSQITSFYGAGAFPLDYPNAWDRIQGKSGHGIWLHGVPPDTYSRPPKTSDGCLVVTNPDWVELSRYIRPGSTPLIITTQVDWLDHDGWLARKQELMAALDGWKGDWQKRDTNGYFSYYAPAYLSRLGAAWREAKANNITQKQWIHVGLSDLSLFVYDDTAVAGLTQSYDSDKHSDITRKSMYLKRSNGQWRIVLEEAIQSTPAIAANN